MSFSFADFQLYTKAPEIDLKAFSVLAPGVIKYVEEVYGIYTEQKTIQLNKFLESGQTSFVPLAYPISTIQSITNDGSALTFTYYGEDVLLESTVTDVRIPLIVTLDVGFAEVPEDLKLAMYSHIEFEYFKYKNSLDNISKVINTDGNTTYFKDAKLPPVSKLIYDRYSPRSIILV